MSDKIAIPRLQQQKHGSSKQRTGRACDPCRQRKSKCDGQKPFCSCCLAQGLNNCTYSDTKHAKHRKNLELAQRKIEGYEELLRDISQELERPTASRVARTLKKFGTISHDPLSRSSDASSSSSIGSLDGIDVVEEDLNRSQKSQATGYMGKNSEVTWMQRLNAESTKRSDGSHSNAIAQHQLPIDNSIASMNYRLDYQTTSAGDMPNAFALPPKSLADRFFQAYLQKVHTALPVIRRDLFIVQYNNCFSKGPFKPGRQWLAVLNMVLGIGRAVCRLSEQETQPESDKHDFVARAKFLNLRETVYDGNDDLQQVQAEVLMAFYFLIASQTNRAWKVIGIAARSGIALGLNLDKGTNTHSKQSDDVRKHLWWSIFRLENILTIMTGRASCIKCASCSASPPLVFPRSNSLQLHAERPLDKLRWTIYLGNQQMNDQTNSLKALGPNTNLYLFYIVDLSMIAHSITEDVYAVDSPRKSPDRIQGRIAFFHMKLDRWMSSLHPAFNFTDDHRNPLLEMKSYLQISLALSYYSVCIMLNRPCLNGQAFRKTNNRDFSSSQSKNENAQECLRVSLATLAILPDEPDLEWSFKVLQWWDFLHVLTQAIVILLLDISIDPKSIHPDGEVDTIESAGSIWPLAKKGLCWLHCLGRTSEAARRAFQFFKSCVSRISPVIGLDLEGIPSFFESSQTSLDPEIPWLRSSTDEETETSERQNHASENLESLSSIDESVMLSYDDRDIETGYQPYHDGVSNAAAVFDTDKDMLDFNLNSDEEVENLLFSMLRSNV